VVGRACLGLVYGGKGAGRREAERGAVSWRPGFGVLIRIVRYPGLPLRGIVSLGSVA